MVRRQIAVTVAVASVVAAQLVGTSQGYPLVLVPQGISNVIESERALLRREGTLRLTAFSRASSAPDGGAVVWCPREQVFFDDASASLWDADGRYAFGPAPRDLDTFPVAISEDHLVTIGARMKRARGRSKGTVDKGVFEFFQRYLNRGNAPSNPDSRRRLVWCPDSIG